MLVSWDCSKLPGTPGTDRTPCSDSVPFSYALPRPTAPYRGGVGAHHAPGRTFLIAVQTGKIT